MAGNWQSGPGLVRPRQQKSGQVNFFNFNSDKLQVSSWCIPFDRRIAFAVESYVTRSCGKEKCDCRWARSVDWRLGQVHFELSGDPASRWCRTHYLHGSASPPEKGKIKMIVIRKDIQNCQKNSITYWNESLPETLTVATHKHKKTAGRRAHRKVTLENDDRDHNKNKPQMSLIRVALGRYRPPEQMHWHICTSFRRKVSRTTFWTVVTGKMNECMLTGKCVIMRCTVITAHYRPLMGTRTHQSPFPCLREWDEWAGWVVRPVHLDVATKRSGNR